MVLAALPRRLSKVRVISGKGSRALWHVIEWRFAGAGYLVLEIAPGVRIRKFEGSSLTVHIAEVRVELHDRIALTGTCPTVFTACELARFGRELARLRDGDAPAVTLRSYRDAVNLVVDARAGRTVVSGFIGHGFFGSLSFNDLELPPAALERARSELLALHGRASSASAGKALCRTRMAGS